MSVNNPRFPTHLTHRVSDYFYTREQFGKELKHFVSNKENIELIGSLAFRIYMHHVRDDDMLSELLLTLNTMELGPEFARSYEELDQIADDLIAGKEVKL